MADSQQRLYLYYLSKSNPNYLNKDLQKNLLQALRTILGLLSITNY